ncbi:MAG: hypothetical protein U5K31_11675 [Balneolaceae bacterium]|nr:hypothetical protein [Balneolaceae bacterium]
MDRPIQQKIVKNRAGSAGFLCLLIFLLFTASPEKVSAQGEGIYITGGLGLPELLHGGVHYRGGLIEAGGSVGYMDLGDNEIFSAGADFFYHFNGYDQFASPEPWYLRVGAFYLKDTGRDIIHNYLYANARVGRDFPLSNRFLVKFDLGLIVQLLHEETEKESYNPAFRSLDVELPAAPSIGVKILYRL